ncbi:uncharacterized protein FIBRA_05999 [Fibroporia radiculosa]|uniref:Uncharacterized protein n=1 Tax=Fibroporia radiculosa TaxID=599839 RepID=J4GS03_9APHY|nr:uncharacterized protein FIBRA_05999 [Fibroporia radiculosa]CCM03850.1 predicted protein [Fibroporia radiculosa]
MAPRTPLRRSHRSDRRAQTPTHAKPLVRSTSLIGSIKNFISSPFTWFTAQQQDIQQDDFEDNTGKRRRKQDAISEDRTDEQGKSRAKRKRVESPEPSPSHPPQDRHNAPVNYLDVPDVMLGAPPARNRPAPTYGRSSSAALPHSSQVQSNGFGPSRPAHHSFSPAGGITRTMSLDPPRFAAYQPSSLSRDASMDSAYPSGPSREVTMSPSRRFNMRSRTSLTPQPSGQTFGPAVPHRERNPTEPPPLSSLMSNPVFVKPPPTQYQPRPLSQDPTITLGSLADARSRSPLSQHTTLRIGRAGNLPDNTDTGYGRPTNAAEKALHDLDVYKTPLLPTRLRGSATVPDMFKSKKLPIPILMTRNQEDEPRLGMSGKKSRRGVRDDGAGNKPYAGQGGMRKLLARRRMEEDEDKQEEHENAMESDDNDERIFPAQITESRKKGGAKQSKAPEPPALSRLTVPDFSSLPVNKGQSSLRVGRTRISRSHATPLLRSKNKFSAVFDDDDADDQMFTSEDNTFENSGAKAPFFQPPVGFSFAKDAPLKLDTSGAKEPPIVTLPFSLSTPSRLTEPQVSNRVQEQKGGPPADRPTIGASSLVPAIDLQSEALASAPAAPEIVPKIALIPPTPGPPAPLGKLSLTNESSSTNSDVAQPSIPNFFANSSIFSKPSVTSGPLVATTPLFSKSPESENPKDSSMSPVAPITAKLQPALSGTIEAPPTAIAWSLPAAATADLPAPALISVAKTGSPSTNADTATSSSITSSQDAASALGATSSSEKPVVQPTPSAPMHIGFDAPAKPTEAGSSTAPSTFSFGNFSANVSETPKPSSPFTFDAPAKAAETNGATSSLPFSFAAPTTTSSTGPVASLPFSLTTTTKIAEATNAPKPFVFGPQPGSKPSEAKAPEPSEASKPSLFGNVSSTPSFAGFGGSTNSSTGSNAEPAKPSFTFGPPAVTPTSITPVLEAPKPVFGTGSSTAFSFGSSATSSTPKESPAPIKSTFSFGAPASTSSALTADKPSFTFGAPTQHVSSTPSPILFAAPSSSNGADVSSHPFSFGVAAQPARPATPPHNDQEVNMDESPTRANGMDTNNGHKEPLKLTTGFTFGAPSAGSVSSPFGQGGQNSTASFSFGAPPSSTNPFGAKPEPKPEIKPTLGFSGFSQSGAPGFPFGQKTSEAPPASASPFGSSTTFGQQPATPTGTAAFTFGTPATNTFGQTVNTSSTPASPSTFGSTPAFSFGATPTSATAPSNPFAFGSQPASPASTGGGLPSASGASNPAFAFGQSSPATGQAPASPFGAPEASAAGGALFVMGSTSAPSQGSGPGGRPVKKLPTRRGGKR